jgi:hypothetical protein
MYTHNNSQLIGVLESVLTRLGRYDEGNPIGTILSFAVSWAARSVHKYPSITAETRRPVQ